MKIWHYSLNSAPVHEPCVITLGNFDGVHLGHKRLLHDAHQHAKQRRLPALVVSFNPHPSVIVCPEHRPKLIMTLDQRLVAFEAAGMDMAWIIPFSRDLSELGPEAFLERLGHILRPVEIHLGRAFRFGKDRAGNIDTVKTWGRATGCEVHTHAQKAPDGGVLSSSRIRDSIQQGLVEDARQMLGRPFALTGIVVEGERRGRHLGFPTANLAWEQEQMPANGVYVTEVKSPHLERPHLGLTNLGVKPSFQAATFTVETHLPHFDGDLYGVRMEIGFHHRLREEHHFTSVDALRAQIAEDVIRGEAWWRDHHHRLG